ncbi:MAG: hypothetical protein R3C11_11955 [Planctomycetaceae bacterium]
MGKEEVDQFIAFLSREYSIDEWSDLAVLEAIDLAEPLTIVDWHSIRLRWKEMGEEVQSRLAELVSDLDIPNQEVIGMLIEMLSSNSSDVRLTSLDSLNSLAPFPADLSQEIQRIIDMLPNENYLQPILKSLLSAKLEQRDTYTCFEDLPLGTISDQGIRAERISNLDP